jgi:hypothetical protein
MKKRKEALEVFEFRGGYSLITTHALETIMKGYRDGLIRKDALRVFAARAELAALHEKSRVDLSRILNCKASLDGVKRLRCGVIDRVGDYLDTLLKSSLEGKERRKCVSRRALRAIAQGRLSCTESVVLLMYFMKRITQVKPLKRLETGERYARFTYGELEMLSGISRANISRAVASLRAKGFLSTVWVVKPNENAFGLLFVDGSLLTLIKGVASKDRSKPEVDKSATPLARISNAPVINLTTLRNPDPKTFISRVKCSSSLTREQEWERIRRRADGMRQILNDQAA